MAENSFVLAPDSEGGALSSGKMTNINILKQEKIDPDVENGFLEAQDLRT